MIIKKLGYNCDNKPRALCAVSRVMVVVVGRRERSEPKANEARRGTSLVHFEGKTDKAAIVNAANPGCLGGGGVDGVISAAGGARLMEDRLHLPVLERRGEYEIRCQVGSA
eukprot:scaffold37458_cov176-Amphora_coffeaeformis.AAC.3